MHSFSKEYTVLCSNEGVQITMERMTLIFSWTNFKAAYPVLCLFWSVSLHHLCLLLNRLGRRRDSSTPDPTFKRSSTERQILHSVRKSVELSLLPVHFYFLKLCKFRVGKVGKTDCGRLHMNWSARHKKSYLSVILSIVSHMGGNISEFTNPLLGTCKKPLESTRATCDVWSPQLKVTFTKLSYEVLFSRKSSKPERFIVLLGAVLGT